MERIAKSSVILLLRVIAIEECAEKKSSARSKSFLTDPSGSVVGPTGKVRGTRSGGRGSRSRMSGPRASVRGQKVEDAEKIFCQRTARRRTWNFWQNELADGTSERNEGGCEVKYFFVGGQIVLFADHGHVSADKKVCRVTDVLSSLTSRQADVARVRGSGPRVTGRGTAAELADLVITRAGSVRDERIGIPWTMTAIRATLSNCCLS